MGIVVGIGATVKDEKAVDDCGSDCLLLVGVFFGEFFAVKNRWQFSDVPGDAGMRRPG